MRNVIGLYLVSMLAACAPLNEEPAEILTPEAAPSVDEPKTLESVEVHQVLALWDSICDVQRVSWRVDSSALFSMEAFRDPLLYFDKQGAISYFQCKNASVLVYADSLYARYAFYSVMDVLGADISKTHIGHFDIPTKELVSTTFSKSGSTHLLVNDMIIHLMASCGESMEAKEQRRSFAQLLSDQVAIIASMSMRCGWNGLEIVR